jgi:hypothetical protein
MPQSSRTSAVRTASRSIADAAREILECRRLDAAVQ